MGIAEDLLRQADHLATYEGSNPSQASLRRAVSTAYYALFHLLVEAVCPMLEWFAGGPNWNGTRISTWRDVQRFNPISEADVAGLAR
jgi:hypothetical protein